MGTRDIRKQRSRLSHKEKGLGTYFRIQEGPPEVKFIEFQCGLVKVFRTRLLSPHTHYGGFLMC